VEGLLEDMDKEDVENAVDSNGNTGLHLASAQNSIETVKALVETFPGLLDAANLDSETSLDVAARHGALAVVMYMHAFQAEDVEKEHRLRDYYACTSCGLCLNGRARFEVQTCAKDREHRWPKNELPRHIAAVRAEDFPGAVAAILVSAGKKNKSLKMVKWWCKKERAAF